MWRVVVEAARGLWTSGLVWGRIAHYISRTRPGFKWRRQSEPCGYMVISGIGVTSEGGGWDWRMNVKGAWQPAGITGPGTVSIDYSGAVTPWNWSILEREHNQFQFLIENRDIVLNNKFSLTNGFQK